MRQVAFFAKERKYSSSLEAALDGGNIPISVYTNLIRTVEEHQQPMQRYLELRKRLLGVEQLHMYDVYVPMIEKTEKKYSFEEAKHMVLNALSVLGSEYTGKDFMSVGSIFMKMRESVQEPIPGELMERIRMSF